MACYTRDFAVNCNCASVNIYYWDCSGNYQVFSSNCGGTIVTISYSDSFGFPQTPLCDNCDNCNLTDVTPPDVSPSPTPTRTPTLTPTGTPGSSPTLTPTKTPTPTPTRTPPTPNCYTDTFEVQCNCASVNVLYWDCLGNFISQLTPCAGTQIQITYSTAYGYPTSPTCDSSGFGGGCENCNVFPVGGPPVSPTPTPTPTPTQTPPVSPTQTPTPSITPTLTPTPSLTPTITPTPSFTPAASPTVTPTVTPSQGSPTPTPTHTPTPTQTATPASTPTPTQTPTLTPSVTPSPGQLAVYTPWTVATTNSPMWVESVYPNSSGFTGYAINWGDGAGQQFFTANPINSNFFLYTYTREASAQTYYTINVAGSGGAGGAPRTLTNRFYVKNMLPSYGIDNFYDPSSDVPTLPYTLNQVLIGSNEWAVSDVINSAFTKLSENFEYLVKISHVLQLNNTISLVEWCEDFVHSPASACAWHTQISGLNDDNSFLNYNSISAVGCADGIIKDIKSYRFRSSSAPDYYTYLAFSASGSIPDHIQVRSNDYLNTLILSATSLGANIPSFTSISAIDVLNNQLYILDYNTVYRVGIDTDSATFNILNQVGGISGTRLQTTGFNEPGEIKAYNDKIYVADSSNSCVKVYNTSLSWLKTLYIDALSAYSVDSIEINRDNEYIFVLGKTFAPIAPVLTNTTTITANGLNTVYSVSWVHDGLRLQNSTTNCLSAFSVYGLVSGGTTYNVLAVSALSATNVNGGVYTNIQTISYIAPSGAKYSNFKVQALGNNNFNSALSNAIPTPTSYSFVSPYRVFELTYNNTLENSFTVPNNTVLIPAAANIQSTDSINKMVIDPTGTFLYFITNSYVYKYLTTGKALNRLTFPSASALGNVELLRTGFIDDRLNFYVATDKRLFKFVDIPTEIQLFDYNTVGTYYQPNSAILIDKNEFIQDWVYNNRLLRLLQNHKILNKAVNAKFAINLDKDGNLANFANTQISFTTAALSSTDINGFFEQNIDNFIHSNEFVTSSVVNRALTKLYTIQNNILNLVAPRITKQLPTGDNNVI